MGENGVKATYKIECKRGLDVSKVGKKIASRQSIGEWKHLVLPEEIHNFEAKTCSTSTDTVTIEFPIENFDTSTANIPALLNVLAGDIFGWDLIKNIRLEDIELPEKIIKLFHGPKFGLHEIRRMLHVKENRPLFGVTIKPSLGVTPKYIAKKCKLIAENGADFITDDEKLVNPSYCTIEHRVEAVSDVLEKVEAESGKKLLYIVNISHSANKICDIAKTVLPYHHLGLMVSFITGGFGCLQAVAQDDSVNVPIWAHRTMHAALSRKPHGIGMNVIARLCRLTGADFQHIGPIGGTDVIVKEHAIKQKNIMTEAKDWFGRKASCPVITGGVNPANVDDTVKMLGPNIAFAVGAAVFDHPHGLKDGVTAMKQAIDCATNKITFEECFQNYTEFQEAVRNFITEK